jgi:NADPH:quinone reductase-like Zn-dependent oxidoreductase
VFGIAEGSFAEYAAADEDKLAVQPPGVNFEKAAAAAISASTALEAVTDVGQIRPGQAVLVVGASGGVGTFAVQLAKALGAHVTAVCSSAKADVVRSIGADLVIDYTTSDVLAGDVRYDVILDIGGRNPLRQLRRALTPRGTLVIVGGEGGGRWTGGFLERQLYAFTLSLFGHRRLKGFINKEHNTILERVATHLTHGDVRSIIDRTYDLEDVADAIRDLEAGTIAGKAVITVR